MAKKKPVGRPTVDPKKKKGSTTVSITAERLELIKKHYRSLSKAIEYVPIPKPKEIENKPDKPEPTIEVSQKVAEPVKVKVAKVEPLKLIKQIKAL